MEPGGAGDQLDHRQWDISACLPTWPDSLAGPAPGPYCWQGPRPGVIMACFAEVASQFTQAGGPYLYARAAFGRFVGIEMGWMLWLVRLAAPAATSNLFVIYCGEFWPHAKEPLPRFLILTFLYGILDADQLSRSAGQHTGQQRVYGGQAGAAVSGGDCRIVLPARQGTRQRLNCQVVPVPAHGSRLACYWSSPTAVLKRRSHL